MFEYAYKNRFLDIFFNPFFFKHTMLIRLSMVYLSVNDLLVMN